MPEKEGQIQVSRKTLLHVSEGIYRSAGSAIKELISNSFDANANHVIINTNYPSFDILTCQDDGVGMSEKEFLRIVQGGIGDSPKESIENNERPIIGKLGIGILAIAQICRSFTIISHHKESKTAFKGKMIFRTDVDKIAKEESLKKGNKNKAYELGKWVLDEKVEFEENKRGVLLFTKDLRQSFVKRFKEDKLITDQNSAPLNFGSLLNLLYINDYRAIKEQGNYFELIWELCELAPLRYYGGSPIRDKIRNEVTVYKGKDGYEYKDAIDFLKSKNDELAKYDFNVIFDNINLCRAVKLPSPLYRGRKFQECQLFYFEYNNIVRKRRLKFHVYMFAQESALRPRDLKGIQIRIKNVGIGLSDYSFMNYDKIESPRDNWIHGEVYVEEGLESALNIDRDSFNENDEQYFILKREIHNFLSSEVFPKVSSFQRKRNKRKREVKKKEKARSFRENLVEFFQQRLNFILYFHTESTNSIRIDEGKRVVGFPEWIIWSNFKARRGFYTNSLLDVLNLVDKYYQGKLEKEELIDEYTTIILD